MKLWHKQLIMFLLAGGVYVVGQYLRGEWFMNFPINVCSFAASVYGTVVCASPYQSVGLTLIALGEVLAVLACSLCLANIQTFSKWLRFCGYYIPVAILLDFVFFPFSIPTIAFSPVIIGREVGVVMSVYLLTFITVCMVLWGLYTENRKKLRVR
ncbi:MAG: hypothetical protein WC030_01470 [Candidatus Paceibacterota bacterium]